MRLQTVLLLALLVCLPSHTAARKTGPVNTPTGAHAHGYSDISFLIPELVSEVQFKKGPYFADEGDFSAAGAANISYVNRLERPLVRLGAGEDGWRRLVGAASPRVGQGFLLGGGTSGRAR